MKRAAIAIAMAAGTLAVAALLAWVFLDAIARAAIEHWGPDVTGVKVEVAEVELSPREGRGRIRGLDLANPAGFSAARAARFGEMRIAVDPATMTSNLVLVRELAIEAPQITYERGSKVTNLDVIQKSIEAYAKASDPAGDKGGASPSPKRKFVIERLTIRKARVLMTTRGLGGQGLTFELPDVELRDVGKGRGGVTVSQAAAIVASTLQQRIAMRLLTNIDALRRGGLEGAIDALKGLAK